MNFYEGHIYRPNYYTNYRSPSGHSASPRPAAGLTTGLPNASGCGPLGGGQWNQLSLPPPPHHVPSAPGLQTTFQQRFHVEHVNDAAAAQPHLHARPQPQPQQSLLSVAESTAQPASVSAQHNPNPNPTPHPAHFAEPNAAPAMQQPGEMHPHMTVIPAHYPAGASVGFEHAAPAATGSQPATLVQPTTISAKQRHPTPGANPAGIQDAHLVVQSIPIANPNPMPLVSHVDQQLALLPHGHDMQMQIQMQEKQQYLLPSQQQLSTHMSHLDGAHYPQPQPVPYPEAQFQQQAPVTHPDAHMQLSHAADPGGQQHNHVDGHHPATQQQQQFDRADAAGHAGGGGAPHGLGFEVHEDGLLHPGPIERVLRCAIERSQDADANANTNRVHLTSASFLRCMSRTQLISIPSDW